MTLTLVYTIGNRRHTFNSDLVCNRLVIKSGENFKFFENFTNYPETYWGGSLQNRLNIICRPELGPTRAVLLKTALIDLQRRLYKEPSLIVFVREFMARKTTRNSRDLLGLLLQKLP